MDKILSINTIKNVFAALGAKTSDSNYSVALLDKTSGEPKGLMGMSELASVLDKIQDYTQSPAEDLNNISVNGIYRFAFSTQNKPGNNAGLVLHFNSIGAWTNLQIAFNASAGDWGIAYRIANDTWFYFNKA